jgi:uncharacterized protein YkwD
MAPAAPQILPKFLRRRKMLTSVGTLCACIALSAAPANPAVAANSSKVAKPSTPATQKAAAPSAKNGAAPAAAIPNTTKKPVAGAAAKPQTATQPRVANKPVAPEVLPLENAIVERTNQERARRGLRPLALDFGLLASARKHAAWMSRRQSLQHTNQPVAENIAMGQNSSAEVVRDWMNSPGHRANILNASYSRIGVAAYTSASGTVYWCQQFLH